MLAYQINMLMRHPPRMRQLLSYARHLNWYLFGSDNIPLTSDLDASLHVEIPTGVAVLWPAKYGWPWGYTRLEPVRRALARFVPVRRYYVPPQRLFWQAHGGFPISERDRQEIGKPGSPKHPYDIAGEVFWIQRGKQLVRCAFDYSDYLLTSDAVLKEVDIYFKCMMPASEKLGSKVVSVGFYPKNAMLLAEARRRFLLGVSRKDIDVYGKFGTWTDNQSIRKAIVEALQSSSLRYHGGFEKEVYAAYLKELIRAKVAVDAPGQGPVTCRLVEAMALGAVVVSRNPTCVFPEEMRSGVHYVAMAADGSDVVEVCRDILSDEEKRQRIAKEALHFFDRNFTPESIARRILIAGVRWMNKGPSSTERLSPLSRTYLKIRNSCIIGAC